MGIIYSRENKGVVNNRSAQENELHTNPISRNGYACYAHVDGNFVIVGYNSGKIKRYPIKINPDIGTIEQVEKHETGGLDGRENELKELMSQSESGALVDFVPRRCSRGMTPGTAIPFSFLTPEEKNLLFGTYRDDPRDSGHFYEHEFTRQEPK